MVADSFHVLGHFHQMRKSVQPGAIGLSHRNHTGMKYIRISYINRQKHSSTSTTTFGRFGARRRSALSHHIKPTRHRCGLPHPTAQTCVTGWARAGYSFLQISSCHRATQPHRSPQRQSLTLSMMPGLLPERYRVIQESISSQVLLDPSPSRMLNSLCSSPKTVHSTLLVLLPFSKSFELMLLCSSGYSLG